MRTVFVNPRVRTTKTRRKSKRRRSRPAARAKPYKRRTKRRTRRRNAGIAPFVQQNPLRVNPLRVNPRRKSSRRKRRNPEFKIKPMLMNTGMMLAGSGAGAGVNLLGMRRIENVWARNGVRIAAAMATAIGFQNTFGGAMAGSLMYPVYAELALSLDLLGESTTTEADLEEISADLEDVMDEIDIDYDADEDDIF